MDEHINFFKDKTIKLHVPHQPCKSFTGIPEIFRQNIIDKLVVHKVVVFQCGKRKIQVTFYAEKCKTYSERKWDECIKRVYIWLKIACQFSPNACAKTLHIHIFMTNLTKLVPSSTTIPLDRVHANTAFTDACSQHSEIIIYREEEWFKVFIHETFHSLGLDFSSFDSASHIANRELEKIFNLQANDHDFRLYESYTETWAEIIHIMMVVHFKLILQKRFVYTYVENVEEHLRQEITFSMIQCTKVLHHNELNYIQLLSSENNHYNEKTNVFSYYIVKCILLFHANEFIQWTMLQNGHSIEFKKTSQNVLKYMELIGKCSQDQNFINSMMQLETQYKIMESRDNTSFGATTMRMTMIE